MTAQRCKPPPEPGPPMPRAAPWRCESCSPPRFGTDTADAAGHRIWHDATFTGSLPATVHWLPDTTLVVITRAGL